MEGFLLQQLLCAAMFVLVLIWGCYTQQLSLATWLLLDILQTMAYVNKLAESSMHVLHATGGELTLANGIWIRMALEKQGFHYANPWLLMEAVSLIDSRTKYMKLCWIKAMWRKTKKNPNGSMTVPYGVCW